MKRGSTLFLKTIVVLMGIAVLALCIFVLPAGIMSADAGGYRPILIGMYIPVIPFFIALYQGLHLLGSIEKNKVFSKASIKMLQIIKYCALAICVLYSAGMPYIFTVADRDDAPGVVALGFIFIVGSLVIATASGIFQNLLQNVVNLKSENDLTV